MPEAGASDPLTERVADVVDAGLQLGASLARTLAGATGSTDVAPKGKPPIDDIVTFGSATASNLIGLVASGARAGIDVSSMATTAAAGRSDKAPARNTPMVTAGSTLRVPLLVENTGQTPTRALTFTTTSVVRAGCEDGEQCTCVPADGVTFTPEALVVAARDFEKLTVRLATPVEAPPGDYRAAVAAGDGWFSTVIAFSVVHVG